MESSGRGSVASRSMTTLHRPLLQYTISSTLSVNAFKGSNSTLYFNLKLDPSNSISSTGRMRRARSIRFLCLGSDLISSVKSERTGSESVDPKSALLIPDKRIYCKKKYKSGGEKEERRREKWREGKRKERERIDASEWYKWEERKLEKEVLHTDQIHGCKWTRRETVKVSLSPHVDVLDERRLARSSKSRYELRTATVCHTGYRIAPQ